LGQELFCLPSRSITLLRGRLGFGHWNVPSHLFIGFITGNKKKIGKRALSGFPQETKIAFATDIISYPVLGFYDLEDNNDKIFSQT
jgi:hypothetical protein